MATIYALCDSRETDPIRRVRYIGQTIRTLHRRLKVHWQTADAGQREHRATWMRSVRASGGEVLIEPLAQVPAAEADRSEIAEIARLVALGCDLTNGTQGGSGVFRRGPVSSETRRRMSQSASKRTASVQTRLRMSDGIKASHARPETVAKLRAFQTGRVRSPETRAKMSAARKGVGNGMAKLSQQAAESIRARYATGGITLGMLANEFRVSAPTIHRVVQRRGWTT